MEPPNRKSADNRFPRQFCAMHEEQENDGGRCCPFEKYRGLSPARQQACNQHRRDEKNREDIRAETKHRSEEHTSELQSLMRISYAVFCLKKKKPISYNNNNNTSNTN